MVIALGLYPFFVQCVGDSLESVSVNVHREYSADNIRLFLDNDDLAGVLILEVSHRRNNNDTLLLLLLIARAYLLGNITAVHIVENSLEADDQLIVLIACVDILGDRQHSDIILTKVVDKNSGLCLVSAQARQILNDDRINAFLIHFLINFFDTVTVEVHTADIIIEGLADYCVSVGLAIVHKDFFLIGQ